MKRDVLPSGEPLTDVEQAEVARTIRAAVVRRTAALRAEIERLQGRNRELSRTVNRLRERLRRDGYRVGGKDCVSDD